MTAPSADTIEKEKDKLFLTDAELIRRLGVPEPDARIYSRSSEEKTARVMQLRGANRAKSGTDVA